MQPPSDGLVARPGAAIPPSSAGATRAVSAWQRSMRWLSVHVYGIVASTLFGVTTPPLTMRRRFERLAGMSREALRQRYPTITFADHLQGDLFVESLRTVEAPERVILYLHGGAFVFGSVASYRRRVLRMAHRCRAEVFLPEYRRAPEHRFPAALDDAVAAWDLVRRLRPDARIYLAGDSAGGGLGLSLLLRLRDAGLHLPDGALLLSPWTDLSLSVASVDSQHGKDLWFTRRHLETWARYYLGDADARSPEASPVYGDYAGLPPLLLIAGGDELLLDDAARVWAKASAAGVDARFVVGPCMQHDYPLTLPWLTESRESWRIIERFFEAGSCAAGCACRT